MTDAEQPQRPSVRVVDSIDAQHAPFMYAAATNQRTRIGIVSSDTIVGGGDDGERVPPALGADDDVAALADGESRVLRVYNRCYGIALTTPSPDGVHRVEFFSAFDTPAAVDGAPFTADDFLRLFPRDEHYVLPGYGGERVDGSRATVYPLVVDRRTFALVEAAARASMAMSVVRVGQPASDDLEDASGVYALEFIAMHRTTNDDDVVTLEEEREHAGVDSVFNRLMLLAQRLDSLPPTSERRACVADAVTDVMGADPYGAMTESADMGPEAYATAADVKSAE